MKKLLIPVLLSLVVLNVSTGCYYDIEDELYAKTTCDTSNVTYSGAVAPALQNAGCMSCHGGTAASGGNIILDTYSSLKTAAQNGSLVGSISHAAGYSPMPQGGNKMSSCDINKISAWVTAGAPNN